MSLTINTKTYTNDVARSSDSYRYLGASHTFSFKDYVDTYRTAPKPTSTSDGQGKAEIKLTRTCTDGTDNVGTAIADFNVSFPVGAATSELQAILDDLAAWLATSAADDLFIDQQINQ